MRQPHFRGTSLREKLQKIFNTTVEVVFGFILVFLILAILLGTLQLSTSVWKLFTLEGDTENYIGIITDVLTLYVLVELSRSLVEYFTMPPLTPNIHRRCRHRFCATRNTYRPVQARFAASHDLRPCLVNICPGRLAYWFSPGLPAGKGLVLNTAI